MAQEYIKIKKNASDSWKVIAQPDEGLGNDFETTYSEDTTRVQSGVMNLEPLFTVEAFAYEASNLTKSEVKEILQIVAKGNKFYMRYYSPYYGQWRDDLFYVGKGSMKIGRLNENGETFDTLSFNMIGVNPIV